MDLDDLGSSRSDTRCGFSWFAPRWLSGLATPKTFLVVYGLLGTLQAMAYIYFVATLTTLEKRFKIPSQTTGIMMSGNEVSQILLSLLLSYLGGRGNRPRWIAWGVAFSGASCLILAVPHLVYGPGKEALLLTKEHAPPESLAAAASAHGSDVDPSHIAGHIGESLSLCKSSSSALDADLLDDGDRCEVGGDLSAMPLALVFISQFVLGIGTTLYFALGQTYLDDNTAKRKTPMLLGVVLALRTVGPALGFLLGWACLSLYIDPSLTPLITKKDPRWLGAWWLGWIILTVALLLFSFLIAMFPKHLPKQKGTLPSDRARELQDGLQPLNVEGGKATEPSEDGAALWAGGDGKRKESQGNVPKLKDFPAALGRLLRNKIIMVNNFSAVFYILGASGYITFTTKYMETQFQQSAAGANIIAGTAGIMAMVAGFLASGIVISKFRPRPRLILGWNVVVGMAYVVGELSFIGLGCSTTPLHGASGDGSLALNSACNSGCGCSQYSRYAPVCSADGRLTFYSACHAGCTYTEELEEPIGHGGFVTLAPMKMITRKYGNCSCIPEPQPFIPGSEDDDILEMTGIDAPNLFNWNTALEGPCASEDCVKPFIAFLVISCVMHFLGSSGRVGNVLVNYRSVKPEDKAIAQGLSLLLVSLLAFIPGPILFGAIIDNVCLVWDTSCGKRGNCWLYHKEYFRFYLNATAAVFTVLAVILDAIVCYLGKDLEFYEDEEEDNGTSSKITKITEDSSLNGGGVDSSNN
ncbi:solute carrier organic anion transporter family member 74D [Ischnura elegans]|uniref:solute carrier organic anion transporter family member 74D n=1 Tax=Ischnura elegans TaxID=197161 RepID=UPI001ED88D07|nr:solute carrier organic anion transporter family member 74D [Ischnura elegans]